MDLYISSGEKTIFARDNGEQRSSGNAQAHLPDSGSISSNIYQILSWNDGLNLWKVLVRIAAFYNITVCYEWIITVGFSHGRHAYRTIGNILSSNWVRVLLVRLFFTFVRIYFSSIIFFSQAKYLDVWRGSMFCWPSISEIYGEHL